MQSDQKRDLIGILETIFRSELDKPNLKLAASDDMDTVTGWDSLAHVRIIAALEAELGMQFDLEEIDEVTSVSKLLAALQKHSTA